MQFVAGEKSKYTIWFSGHIYVRKLLSIHSVSFWLIPTFFGICVVARHYAHSFVYECMQNVYTFVSHTFSFPSHILVATRLIPFPLVFFFGFFSPIWRCNYLACSCVTLRNFYACKSWTRDGISFVGRFDVTFVSCISLIKITNGKQEYKFKRIIIWALK